MNKRAEIFIRHLTRDIFITLLKIFPRYFKGTLTYETLLRLYVLSSDDGKNKFSCFMMTLNRLNYLRTDSKTKKMCVFKLCPELFRI